MLLDIEVYNTKIDKWAQATYLVHGYNDVCWTNDMDEVLLFLRGQLAQIEEQLNENY